MNFRNRFSGLVVYLVMPALSVSFYGLCVTFHNHYNAIYHNAVSFSDRVVDLTGYERVSDQPIRLLGRIEFYYNRRIITDSDSGAQPDGHLARSYGTVRRDAGQCRTTGAVTYSAGQMRIT